LYPNTIKVVLVVVMQVQVMVPMKVKMMKHMMNYERI
jgi:hypothetical protein